ncbi:MAG: hypothetical protein ACI9LO_003424 [Planctomycetota bacterium]|jgi:uncharacterized protein involved in response to NO
MPTERNKLLYWPAVLGYGFRPFFLPAAIHAVIAMSGWLIILQGFGSFTSPIPFPAWHEHEMLYGFIVAAMAGFLLTAVPSWTGSRGYAGGPLLGLTLLWIAGAW